MNKTVLVSAYTSNALDNILLGYKKHSSNFLRIGSSGHLELENYCTNYLRDTVETTDQLKALYDSAVTQIFHKNNGDINLFILLTLFLW